MSHYYREPRTGYQVPCQNCAKLSCPGATIAENFSGAGHELRAITGDALPRISRSLITRATASRSNDYHRTLPEPLPSTSGRRTPPLEQLVPLRVPTLYPHHWEPPIMHPVQVTPPDTWSSSYLSQYPPVRHPVTPSDTRSSPYLSQHAQQWPPYSTETNPYHWMIHHGGAQPSSDLGRPNYNKPRPQLRPCYSSGGTPDLWLYQPPDRIQLSGAQYPSMNASYVQMPPAPLISVSEQEAEAILRGKTRSYTLMEALTPVGPPELHISPGNTAGEVTPSPPPAYVQHERSNLDSVPFMASLTPPSAVPAAATPTSVERQPVVPPRMGYKPLFVEAFQEFDADGHYELEDDTEDVEQT